MTLIPSDIQCAMADLCEMAVDHMDKYPHAGIHAGGPQYIKNARELANRWRSLSEGERASLRNGTALVGMQRLASGAR